MDFLIGLTFVAAVVGIIVVLRKMWDKRRVAKRDERERKEQERKRQEEERKQQEEERKKQEALDKCAREGHDFAPLTGEPLGYLSEFLQMDHRGYQKEQCRCCGLRRVSDKRLVEIDAPEFQPEYSTEMYWLLDDDHTVIGRYSIEIDTEQSAYLYLTQNVDADARRGDIYACMRIKGTGLFSEEHIEKNEEYPRSGELTRGMLALDENGERLTVATIKCLGQETYDALGVDEQLALLKDFQSGAKDYPEKTILITYQEGTKSYKPAAIIKG
jgi:hypothetical protein